VSSAHTDAQLDHAVTQIKAALAAFYQK
jgi:hypothetical protein